MNKDFLLDALKHEQGQVLLYMSLNKRRQFAESWWLDYALEVVIEAIRDYRDDRIDQREAYALYNQVSRVVSTCSTAFAVYEYEQRRKLDDQWINDTLRNWYQRGLITRDDDGLWDWVAGGRAQVLACAA